MLTRIWFLLGELLFLAITHVYGGPPWTVLGVIAVIALVFVDVRVASLALLAPSLLWLGFFHATGNRELFFPYAMYLASHVALKLSHRSAWLGALAGAIIVAAFLSVRVLQEATLRVLAVEFVVAAAVLSLALAAHARSRKSVASELVIAAAASLLAYASLAL